MKIVFLSNYFTHHQKSLSDSLFDLTGGKYRFVETENMSEERKRMGYQIYKSLPYLYHPDEIQEEELLRWVRGADVVIVGSAPERYIRARIRAGKLVFRYSERPLKNGAEYLKYLPRLVKWHLQNPAGAQIYMLCASSFTAADYNSFFLFRNRCYRWGYFPELTDKLITKKKNTLIWCGRLIDWKHPEAVVYAANSLKKKNFDFSMKIIGNGPMGENLKDMIRDFGLENIVEMTGAMNPEDVRREMESTEIFISSSDRREGWGAVINEAMSSRCCVVAGDAAGAVPFLIENGRNGMVFHDGNWDELTEILENLLNHPDLRESLSSQGERSIIELWNGRIAAERLVKTADAILETGKAVFLFESGPCSQSPVLRDNWFSKSSCE